MKLQEITDEMFPEVVLRVYEAIKPGVRVQDHAELLRMLQIAYSNKSNFSGGSYSKLTPSFALISGFMWHNTPQGHDYWFALFDSLKKAGF